MLDELRGLHAALLAAIAEMEGAVADKTFDQVALASARWKLSRASRRRQRLVDGSILPCLLEQATPSGHASLVTLREEARVLSAASTAHVGKWNANAIAADWGGYREASAAITKSMRTRVAAEQRYLYPMLHRPDRG